MVRRPPLLLYLALSRRLVDGDLRPTALRVSRLIADR